MFRKKRFWLGLLGLIVLVVFGGMALNQMKARQAKAAAVARATPLQTPYAAIASGKADVEGGIIQIAARTAGIVRTVNVQEGDAVKKGEILAQLEDDQPRLAAQTADANLKLADAQVANLQV